MWLSAVFRLRSHLIKELEINDTPYGLRVMTTDHPTNKSVGSCPKDISTNKLNQLVALHESIWMGSSPDWTALQIHLGGLMDKSDLNMVRQKQEKMTIPLQYHSKQHHTTPYHSISYHSIPIPYHTKTDHTTPHTTPFHIMSVAICWRK